MNYCALYRKYRPTKFEEIYGQKVAKKILCNSILNNKMAHAYIFYGPRGTGKTSMARLFSKTINCENLKNMEPCLNCNSCINTNQKECVDIIEIDAASNNGVDEIRELKSKINLVPNFLKYKVYIIDEVHMLSSGAFNALLKTLEEPPDHVVFILATTEIYKIPLTILSRCQTIEFKNIDDVSMGNRLTEIAIKENIKIEKEAINEIVKNSQGGMRDAIGLLDKAQSYSDEIITLDDIKQIIGSVSNTEIKIMIEKLHLKDLKFFLEKIELYSNDGYDLLKIINDIIIELNNQMLSNGNFETKNEILKFVEYQEKMKNSDNKKILFEVLTIELCQTNVCINENKIVEDKININNVVQNKMFTISIETRVNNTFVDANKIELNKIKNLWKELDQFTFDKEFGALICDLIDTTPVLFNGVDIIVEAKYESLAEKINLNIVKYEQVLREKLDFQVKMVALSDKNWQIYKKEYLEKIKNGVKYEYIEEKENKKENVNITDTVSTLEEKAIELFGNVVS